MAPTTPTLPPQNPENVEAEPLVKEQPPAKCVVEEKKPLEVEADFENVKEEVVAKVKGATKATPIVEQPAAEPNESTLPAKVSKPPKKTELQKSPTNKASSLKKSPSTVKPEKV